MTDARLCRADAAASTSLASHPIALRSRRAAVRSRPMAAGQAGCWRGCQPPARVPHMTRAPPRLSTRKPTCATPAAEQAADGQQQPGVEPPPESPETRRRNAELQAGGPPAWPDNAAELTQRFLRVSNITQQVSEGQGVEGGIGEWQLLSPARNQADAVGLIRRGDISLPFPEHLLSQIQADDAGVSPRRDLQGDTGCSRRYVEHRLAG